jgi:hypothetical protein
VCRIRHAAPSTSATFTAPPARTTAPSANATPATFGVGRLDHPSQQGLTLTLGPPEPAGEGEGDRQLEQREQDERAEEGGGEPRPDAPALLGDPLVAVEASSAERELLPAQARLVGVQDPAAPVPDLHPHQGTGEGAGAHDLVEGGHRPGIVPQDGIVEGGPDGQVADQGGGADRGVDRHLRTHRAAA